ncbi:MAG TPA: DUF1801 domain-containing protein [Streptosporangiaceae bacterium]|nr:DUF1801 domain-containing protein [Streptosporangiaceae bacterium]
MNANADSGTDGQSVSQEIDAIIAKAGDWRSLVLSQLRAVIKKTDPAVVEEVKWKKPSKPEGVPVWSHDGILCLGDTFKNSVRLTFLKGAQLEDPNKIFNTRMDSNTARAIDFREGDVIDEQGLRAVVLAAVELNTSKGKRSGS